MTRAPLLVDQLDVVDAASACALALRRSERTAGSRPACSSWLRTWSASISSRSPIAASSSSSSSSVISISSASTRARRARSALTLWRAPARSSSRNSSSLRPVAPRNWPEAHALALEPVVEVVDPLAQLLEHQLLGDLLGHQLGERLHRLLLEGHLGLDDLALAQPLGDVGPELLERVELGGLGGPLVVGVGERPVPSRPSPATPNDDGLASASISESKANCRRPSSRAAGRRARGPRRPLPDLVEEVLGGQVLVLPLGVGLGPGPADVDGHLVTVWTGRATSTSSPDVARRRSIWAVDLLVGHLEAGSVTTRPP